jgi:hypothetical protein
MKFKTDQMNLVVLKMHGFEDAVVLKREELGP